METVKKIGNKIKVILTQLISFILSFFKTDEDGGRVLKKDEENINHVSTKKDTIISNGSTTLPDEADSKSDNHLSYKQSISTINKDMKEEIKNKVHAKEIYFSEIVIVNTILEVIEEKNNFIFSELSEEKKESVKNEVEKIKDRIIPSIKKEMLNNKIKTKEELKVNVSKKINNLHYNSNPIKKILNKKEEIINDEEKKPEIIIEDKELNIKPIKKKHIISIVPIEEEIEEKKDPEDFISIKKDKDKQSHKHNPADEVYFMADILPDKKKNINLPETVKVNIANNLISETKKETAEAMKIKSEKIPFMMVPNNKKNKVSAKDRIKNAVIDTSILLASLPLQDEDEEKELTKEEKPVKSIYKLEEEISPEEAKIADIEVDREILEEIRNDIRKQQQMVNSSFNVEQEETKDKIASIKEMEKVKDTTLNINQEMANKKENILNEIEKENKDIITKLDKIEEEIVLPITKEEKKKEEEKEETMILPISVTTKEKEETKEIQELKELEKDTEEIIINTNNEIKKEDLEDKEYEEYENKIDDLLYNIEMYKIKNEDSLTPNEKDKLNKEKNKLKNLKSKLENQKDLDIAQEKKELEVEITKDEIEGIQKELKQMHIEHQEEANESIIKKLTKMEEESDAKLAEIEQQLIKSKLKKAAKVAEVPSILALPFVRSKYFFYFTIGLFINNHFNFLNAIFKRRIMQYEPIDLTEIKNGYDALDKALDKTYENIVYLDYLENESLKKYPSLKDDEEFTKNIKKIRTKLNNNYEKLQNKQKMINKYIKKVNKKNKVFKKYKLVKDENKS